VVGLFAWHWVCCTFCISIVDLLHLFGFDFLVCISVRGIWECCWGGGVLCCGGDVARSSLWGCGVGLSGGVVEGICFGWLVVLGVYVEEVWLGASVGWVGLLVWALMGFVRV